MSEQSKRPKVFPSNEEKEELEKATKMTENPNQPNEPSPEEKKAAEEMKQRTEQQLKEKRSTLEEQEEKAKQLEQNREVNYGGNNIEPPENPPFAQKEDDSEDDGNNGSSDQKENINVPHDVLPLPSEGKLYPSKKKSIRVAYLTASDENILTSPNLIENGDYIKVLLERKILDDDITYEDLHTGDRNAILIWLRATGYGPEYPVKLTDPSSGEDFETTVDLNNLKSIKLGAEPDKEGLFDFKLPTSGKNIKFKLLSVGDVDEIEKQIEYETSELGSNINNSITYTLSKHIVEIEGNRDQKYIWDFVNSMVVRDSRALRKYIDDNESGIDMNITVRTPGGESYTYFLPIGPKFFWPDLGT